mmetsp:Transcript_1806/g.6658  ORF Transcript_1806/g.6658 Transcript_1806/m.6658 type:complete len:240 (+) Transcript_1806:233-952(+)
MVLGAVLGLPEDLRHGLRRSPRRDGGFPQRPLALLHGRLAVSVLHHEGMAEVDVLLNGPLYARPVQDVDAGRVHRPDPGAARPRAGIQSRTLGRARSPPFQAKHGRHLGRTTELADRLRQVDPPRAREVLPRGEVAAQPLLVLVHEVREVVEEYLAVSLLSLGPVRQTRRRALRQVPPAHRRHPLPQVSEVPLVPSGRGRAQRVARNLELGAFFSQNEDDDVSSARPCGRRGPAGRAPR